MLVTAETMNLAQRVLDYWDRFNNHNQNYWVQDAKPVISTKVVDGKEYKVCNSTMCAAGTAVFLADRKLFRIGALEHHMDDDWWESHGADALGLDDEEAGKLFYSSKESARVLMEAIARGDEHAFHEHAESYEYAAL